MNWVCCYTVGIENEESKAKIYIAIVHSHLIDIAEE